MIQIIMPLAGEGMPFHERGQPFPKSLTQVRGHPLVEYAIKSVIPPEDHCFIFVIRPEHNEQFYLQDVLALLAPGCRCVFTNSPTAGALCTVLLAIDEINPEEPLIVANGDQYLPDGIDDALTTFRKNKWDVGVITFKAVHPRWSFIRMDEDGMVVETAEKRPISEHATVGHYYFRQAGMYLRAAKQSLLKNSRVNNQFYVCPTINELILEGCSVGHYQIPNSSFFPLGIPDDIDSFNRVFSSSPLDDETE